jgi:nucleotide-binding universal stress UspA family protein
MALVHKILVATDFSDAAARALEMGATLSEKLGVPLLLFHAYGLPAVYTPEGVIPVPIPVERDVRGELDGGLARLATRARELGAHDVQTISVTGDAWREIVRAAKDHGCDLIVMGSHGRGVVERVILGSVAEKVVRKAECAVLTVKVPSH